MPDELVSAYDWTSSLEKQMKENFHSGSQKVLRAEAFPFLTNRNHQNLFNLAIS